MAKLRSNDGLGRCNQRRHDMTFDEWWKQTKPAECDELKPYFEEAWEISATTEREACAKVCEGLEDCFADHLSNNAAVAALVCADKIRMRSNVELTGSGQVHRPESSEQSE